MLPKREGRGAKTASERVKVGADNPIREDVRDVRSIGPYASRQAVII